MSTETEHPPHDLSHLVIGDKAAVEAVYHWIKSIDAGVRDLARALHPALQAGNLDLPAKQVIFGAVAQEAEHMGMILRDRSKLRAAVAPPVWERVEIVLDTAAGACDTLRAAPQLSMDARAMKTLLGAITCHTGELSHLVRLLACAQVQRGDVQADTQTTDLLDLGQIAALAKKQKRTLENYKRRQEDPLPAPDYPGGGGKCDYWSWGNVRPWLMRNCKFPIPENFPDIYRR
jgi:hypothetical protein